MRTPSDYELALQVRLGEAESYGELVRRYQTSVFNVCYRLMAERQEAEDLTQEAFIRAFRGFDHYDIERPFGPWMRRVAANLCLNHLQVKRVASMSLDDERDEPIIGRLEDPEASLERSEQAEAVRTALFSLPSHYRVVIELRHFQDLSYAEIAAKLEIPVSAVKSHLFRSRRLLEKKLRSNETKPTS